MWPAEGGKGSVSWPVGTTEASLCAQRLVGVGEGLLALALLQWDITCLFLDRVRWQDIVGGGRIMGGDSTVLWSWPKTRSVEGLPSTHCSCWPKHFLVPMVATPQSLGSERELDMAVWKQALQPGTSHISCDCEKQPETPSLSLPSLGISPHNSFLPCLGTWSRRPSSHDQDSVVVSSESSLGARRALRTYALWELTLRKGEETTQNTLKPL